MLLKFSCHFTLQDTVDYEALGLKRPEKPEIDICDIYLFKDKIVSFNEHTEDGLCVIRTSDGYAFIVEISLKQLLKKLQEDAE